MKLLLTADLHRDGTKLLWLLDEAPEHAAMLIAGDHLDLFSKTLFSEQSLGFIRWKNEVLKMGRSLAWCSGNHDFFHDESSARVAASPSWMRTKMAPPNFLSDGKSQIIEVGSENLAVTTIPWPSNPISKGHFDFARRLLREGGDFRAEGIPWIVLCHEPPANTPLCLNYQSPESEYTRILIAEFEPDFSLHGHLHEAFERPGGSWFCRIGKTVCFNAGQSEPNKAPHFIQLELCQAAEWEAIWYGNGRMERIDPSRINSS